MTERESCGYCGKRFSVTLRHRQIVCVTPDCPARSDYDGPLAPDFDAVVEIAHDGAPCFDTKYSEQFWYLDNDGAVARYDLAARNVIIPLPFASRREITPEVVAELREKGAGPVVLVRRPPGHSPEDRGGWGVFTGHWPEDV